MLFKNYRKNIAKVCVVLLSMIMVENVRAAQNTQQQTISSQSEDSTRLKAAELDSTKLASLKSMMGADSTALDSLGSFEKVDSLARDLADSAKLKAPLKYEAKRYKVENGKLVDTQANVNLIEEASLGSDSTRNAIKALSDTLTKAERRAIIRSQKESDPFITFRDSMPVSRVLFLSLPLPGFSQIYNKQYYKLPILYGLAGTSAYFYTQQNNKYKEYKTSYDYMVATDEPRSTIDPVQTKMIQHNTYRQIFLVGAVASYIYFIGDGALNYKYESTNIKMATTLSTICPGAGQYYNKSFWKVPIVMGSFATFAYMIDFNNRGYQRFKTAYNLLMDDDDATVDEFSGRYSSTVLANLRKSYRRNRDLCIIATAGLYLLNIIDAHVDAHLQDYDVSDQLSNFSIQPTTFGSSLADNQAIGLSLNYKF